VYEKTLNSRSRLVIYLFILIPFCIVAFRLYYLQIEKSEYFKFLADRQHNIYYKITPNRGTIYDRKHKKLAFNFDIFSCYANPRKIIHKEKVAAYLSNLFDIDKETVLERLNKDKAFIWIKRHLSEKETEQIKSLNISGINLIKESNRFYPNQSLASHVLGYVDIDNKGLEGIELYYDDYLKGAPGLNIVTRDAKGRIIEANQYQITSSLESYDLVLTLDRFIQYIAEREIDKVYKKYKAKSAVIIVMNPENGEILALANRPTFDPNKIDEYQAEARRNRAITDIFEPGSVFKMVTATAALNEQVITLDDKIYCEEGEYKIYNHILHDHKPFKELTFKEIIEHSSNIGVVKTAQRLNKRDFYNYIKDFGFGQATGVDLPGERTGIIRRPADWSKISISAIPIGQEIAVTALQMLSATSAIGNDGVLMKPHIVKSIVKHDNETVKQIKPQTVRKVAETEAIDKVKQALLEVVESGTGTRADFEGYSICGKTGTAQKIKPGGGYSHSSYIASFAGFLPKDNPKLAIIVVVDEPRPVYYGGHVAAPVFKAVAKEVMRYIENYGLN
jgi:cell division protein FtsI/penicillin-binding protein 2